MIGGKYLNLKFFGDKKGPGFSGTISGHQTRNINNSDSNETNHENFVGECDNNKNVEHKNKIEKNNSFIRDRRIIHEGWLNKWTNIIGSYRPRYFMLENGILRYSIDKYSPTKETFVLSHCKIRVCPDDPLHFEIETTEQGILYLKADLPEQKHKWYISFKKAQLNYMHGNFKRNYVGINSFITPTKHNSILDTVIKSSNEHFGEKNMMYEMNSRRSIQNNINDTNLAPMDMTRFSSIQTNDARQNKTDKENGSSTTDLSENDSNRIYDWKKINFDDIFISCTDFEEKNPTLCLMENIVSLKEVTREVIKDSDYENAKKFLNNIKSADLTSSNWKKMNSYLLKLTNSVECINLVIEKYINCSEMLLKEENIQTKCINKSLKLLAKQNYFLEQSQQNDLLGDRSLEVTMNLEKLDVYESEPESEDMFFDCDEPFSETVNASSSMSTKRASLKADPSWRENAPFITDKQMDKETHLEQKEPIKEGEDGSRRKKSKRGKMGKRNMSGEIENKGKGEREAQEKENEKEKEQYEEEDDKEKTEEENKYNTRDDMQKNHKMNISQLDDENDTDTFYNSRITNRVARNPQSNCYFSESIVSKEKLKGDPFSEGGIMKSNGYTKTHSRRSATKDSVQRKPKDSRVDNEMNNEETKESETHHLKDSKNDKDGNMTVREKNKILDNDDRNNYDGSDSDKMEVASSGDSSIESGDYDLFKLCSTKEVKSIDFKEVGIYTDESIPRRTKLPSPRTELKISLWSLLKDCIGKDLSRICMPIYLNEPSSFLQRLAEDFQYIYLLKYASKQMESAARLAFVTAFTISPYGSVIGRTYKPFNPLLGETYELSHRKFFFVAEQVLHHPPVTAYHCHNDYMENFASIVVNVQILGKSIQVNIPGANHLILKIPKTFNGTTKANNKNNLLATNSGSCTSTKTEMNREDGSIKTNNSFKSKNMSTSVSVGSDSESGAQGSMGMKRDLSPKDVKLGEEAEEIQSQCGKNECMENSENKKGKLENSNPKNNKKNKGNIDKKTKENDVNGGGNTNNKYNIGEDSTSYSQSIPKSCSGENSTNGYSLKKKDKDKDKEKVKQNKIDGNIKNQEDVNKTEKKKKQKSKKEHKKTNEDDCVYEHYTYQRANMIIHNIIFGKLWVELHGNYLIRNHNNGDFSVVRYIRKGWFDQDIHKVRAIICDRFKNVIFFIHGKWSQELYVACVRYMKKTDYSAPFFNADGTENKEYYSINALNEFINNFDWQFFEANIENMHSVCIWKAQKRPKNSDQYYGFNYMTMELNEITPEYDPSKGAAIACTDSRFRPDQRYYEMGNIEIAMSEKQRLENKQRQKSKLYGPNYVHKPMWFYKHKDPIHHENDIYLYNHKYWDAKKNNQFPDAPDIF